MILGFFQKTKQNKRPESFHMESVLIGARSSETKLEAIAVIQQEGDGILVTVVLGKQNRLYAG